MSDNNLVFLITGPPNSGKTTSLWFLDNPEKYVYLNTDRKPVPFKDKFLVSASVDEPLDMLDYLDQVELNDDVEGVIIDTVTFMMDMFETLHVVNSADTRSAWGEYAQFYKTFIHKMKSGKKKYILIAHEEISLNAKTNQYESKVPVKGAVGRTGAEADFTTILAAREVETWMLEKYENDLLTITDEEEEDGIKRVFVTRINKEITGNKMRSAMGLWDRSELYIDNNAQNVINRLSEYYGK